MTPDAEDIVGIARAIVAGEVPTDEKELHARDLAESLLRAVEALERIRDKWKHASDCDVSLGQPEQHCDCYHGVARECLQAIGANAPTPGAPDGAASLGGKP